MLSLVHPITGLRRLLYLITPNETLYETVEEVPAYVDQSYPYFAMLIIIEFIIRLLQRKSTFRINDSISSISAGILSQLPLLFYRSIEMVTYIWVYENYRLYELNWRSPYTWFFGFLGVDFGYYWVHRAAHEVSLFWGGHQVHHSSEEYNLTTALRQSFFQRYFSWWFYLPLALVMPPSVFSVHMQFNLIYQFWIHTEIVRSLGPLEFIFNTPSHHRVHHGRNPYCIDKNYGGTLIIFDRLFDTFQAERPSEPLAYGLVHPLTTYDPIEVQICHLKYVFKTALERKGLLNKIKTLFNGPGWEPGKPRLGDPADIPEVTGPVPAYNPASPNWLKVYSFFHFLVLILLYDALALLKKTVPVWLSLAMVFYFLLGLTAFGNILDRKTRAYGVVFETIRCFFSLFFIAILKNIFVLPGALPSFSTWIVAGFFLSSGIFWIVYLIMLFKTSQTIKKKI